VNDLADSVKVVKTHQALLGHDPDKWKRGALVVVPLDDLKEVHAEDLKDHNEMLSMWTMMQQAVQELNAVAIVACNVLKLARVVLVVLLQ
jgi:diadenosine tetraphosphate (Ap4A) HIT family hydrolase